MSAIASRDDVKDVSTHGQKDISASASIKVLKDLKKVD